jgi:hypothetical protein
MIERARSWKSERELLMRYAAPCFVELVVAASRDERSAGAPIQVKQYAAAEYFRFHPRSGLYSYNESAPVPLPPDWHGNINGNVGARQTGGATEAMLIEEVPDTSPKAWRVRDERGALERFPTTVPIPDSLTFTMRGGVAILDRPGGGASLEAINMSRPRRAGWEIRYGHFDDLPDPQESTKVNVDEFSVYVATTEHLLRSSDEHRALVAAARSAVGHLHPQYGTGGDLLPDLAWDCAAGRVVAEVKTLGETSEDTQLRLGLGQVLQYRWQEDQDRRTDATIAVLIVSREPCGPWVDVCNAAGIRLVWPPFAFDDLLDPPSGTRLD